MRIQFTVSLACVLTALAFPVEANAAEHVTAQCTTEPTGLDGPKRCESPWQMIKARKGYYFDQDSLKEIEATMTAAGSCDIWWRDLTTIGKRRGPRKFGIRATARTSRYPIGDIGKTVCTYSVKTLAYE